MRSTSRIRRAVGAAAVGMLGVTTVAIAVAGVAHAAPPSFTVSGSGSTAPVPPGICSIEWTVSGAAGGAAGAGAGSPGGDLTVTLPAYEGDHY
ncbi:MAG: hypothetical protein AVDCRST_MAG57-2677, partial [uncultured Blastococcus sp.]